MGTVAPLVERDSSALVSCCSFVQSKDLLGFTDDPPREHEIEQFLRHIEHVRTLTEEARPGLTNRDKRFNVRGHRAS